MKTDSEIMSKIIKWMISEVNNDLYIQKLNIILQGIDGKKYIEENRQPRFQSIVLFGINLFPFTMAEYRKMSELIKEE